MAKRKTNTTDATQNSNTEKKSAFRADKLFEETVGLILRKMYPNYNFRHTEYSHDGGKDFYATYGSKSFWAEAKCHQRHLELSRIAGTFIMADLCKINSIIVFSRKRLTSGALTNLAKYCEHHNKNLIVYNETDFNELIPYYGKFDTNVIVSDMLSYQLLSDTAISELLEKLKCAGEDAKDIWSTAITNLPSAIYKNRANDEFIYKLLAYVLFNNAVDNSSVTPLNRCVKVIDNNYFLQANCGTPVTLGRELKAFNVFSNEIVLHNEHLHNSKKVNIRFSTTTSQYKVLTDVNFKARLLPGQCLSKIFYFKALNDTADIELPSAEIKIEKKLLEYKLTNRTLERIPCRIIGETSYLGNDNNKLSVCAKKLDESERRFQSVVVYGKSGVGKSRFLYELHSARLQQGNKSYSVQGDNSYESLSAFLRPIICAHYDIDFDAVSGRVYSPTIKGVKTEASQINDFVLSVLNGDSDINANDARNWLITLLKNNCVSLFVDNCQRLSDEILQLLNSAIVDLQNCKCRSEIILSFNTDLCLNDATAGAFLNFLKANITDFTFRIEVTGFDLQSAILYLKSSLDPENLRNDLDKLCAKIINKAYGSNNENVKIQPLLLKQIVLYLFQQNIISFRNNTVCILDIASLENAIECLPENLYLLIQERYKLLLSECDDQHEQLADLMWLVLVFGELPETSVNKIDGIMNSTLKKCVELGFLKYTAKNEITFEHQLIEKSILLMLENLPYHNLPVITEIKLRKSTTDKLISDRYLNRRTVEFFVLKERYYDITDKDFNKILETISIGTVTELLIPYALALIDRYVRKFNAVLPPTGKIDALRRLIDVSQDRLGVSRTQNYFRDIIDFQQENYEINHPCAVEFIELLKTYQYQLPNDAKEDFLKVNQKIAESLFSGQSYLKELRDYRIWNCWAYGKHYLNVYDYETAKDYIDKGIELAREINDNHRIAELNMLAGDMYACLDEREKTIECWKLAARSFNTEKTYDIVLSKVYEGNVALLNYDYNTARKCYEFLKDKYDDNQCFTFLKSVINDYISNFLIITFINGKTYSETADADIKIILNRFRSLAVVYQSKTYMHAAHKSLSYYKYLLENFSELREGCKVREDAAFSEVISKELLANYDDKNGQFIYFYPVLKEIAETPHISDDSVEFIANSVPESKKDIFKALSQNRIPVTAPKLLKGLFDDLNHTLMLFHFSYYWQ